MKYSVGTLRPPQDNLSCINRESQENIALTTTLQVKSLSEFQENFSLLMNEQRTLTAREKTTQASRIKMSYGNANNEITVNFYLALICCNEITDTHVHSTFTFGREMRTRTESLMWKGVF